MAPSKKDKKTAKKRVISKDVAPEDDSSQSSFSSLPEDFSDVDGLEGLEWLMPSKKKIEKKYWTLRDVNKKVYAGGEKWREVIDMRDAVHGHMVYDKCLHGRNGGVPEPGFLESIENAFLFIGEHLGERTTTDMWLECQSICAAHFAGSDMNVVGSSNDQGKLRPKADHNTTVGGTYKPLDNEAKADISAMRPRIVTLQKTLPRNRRRRTFFKDEDSMSLSLSTHYTSSTSDEYPSSYILYFNEMKRARRRRYFDYYLDLMYHELRVACRNKDRPAALMAITKCHQNMQRLHACGDGTQRTSVVFLGKHLAEFGFDLTLLWMPHDADVVSYKSWNKQVSDGMKFWQRVAKGKVPNRDDSGSWSFSYDETESEFKARKKRGLKARAVRRKKAAKNKSKKGKKRAATSSSSSSSSSSPAAAAAATGSSSSASESAAPSQSGSGRVSDSDAAAAASSEPESANDRKGLKAKRSSLKAKERTSKKNSKGKGKGKAKATTASSSSSRSWLRRSSKQKKKEKGKGSASSEDHENGSDADGDGSSEGEEQEVVEEIATAPGGDFQFAIVEMQGKGMVSFPPEIFESTKLRELRADRNALTEVPASIGQLPRLEKLFLTSNVIHYIDPAISRLKNLSQLHLSFNDLSEIPLSLFKLASLEVLMLTGNQITTVPPIIGSLRRLKKLGLGGNCIASLPAALGDCTQLEMLGLSSNRLKGLPASVGSLSRLLVLNLSDNPLGAGLAADWDAYVSTTMKADPSERHAALRRLQRHLRLNGE